MKQLGYLDNLVPRHATEAGRSWRPCFAFCVVAMLMLVSVGHNARSDDAGQDTGSSTSRTLPAGFAYDPQMEEGPHPESDFEWWYHFGFLRRKGAPEFEYSFVSSFQRNKSGRYLFYNLSKLDADETSHHGLVDRSLLGLTARPETPQAETGTEQPSEGPGILRRLAYWIQDALPLLPERHEFLPPSNLPPPSCRSELSLVYGDNRLEKVGNAYELVYHNSDFVLELTLRAVAPPMPMLGTGLTGLHKPEDQYYYTYPRMSATGLLRRGEEQWEMEGDFWYDHQWGKVVSTVPKTWGWWGLRLRDGRNLAVFFLRDGQSGDIVQQGLTLHHPDGRTEVYRDVTFKPLRDWNSPHGRRYAVEWQIEARELNMTIRIRPYSDNHELPVLLYGRIWEGPCRAEIIVPGEPTVQASGFQELIGEIDER